MRHLVVFLLLLVPVCSFGQTAKDSISREMKLPEVTVKMKPIRQVGDTLNYNVSSFRGKDDHYLVDVLKKLPGIEVSDIHVWVLIASKEQDSPFFIESIYPNTNAEFPSNKKLKPDKRLKYIAVLLLSLYRPHVHVGRYNLSIFKSSVPITS